MADPRLRLVLNPHAGAGAAGRKLPEIVRALARHDLSVEVARTSGPGDATRLARTSFDDGIDIIVVVGGDGTLNEVTQAYVDDDGEPKPGPEIALIPVSTGGDFKRTLGLTGSIDDAVQRLRTGQTRAVDLGIMQLVSLAGAPITRAFVNVTSFGIGGITDKLVNEAPKWVGGRAAFFVGSARAMLTYRNASVRVRVDDREFFKGPVFNVAVANGRFFGGGMMIAPHADLANGLMDVVCLGDMSRLQVLSLGSRIYRGEHLAMPKVSSTRGERIEAESLDEATQVLVDMDGETPGRLPIRIRVAHEALKVRV